MQKEDQTSGCEFVEKSSRTFIPCLLPIQFVKGQFMKELETHKPKGLMHDRLLELWSAGYDAISKEVYAAKDFESLNNVFLERGRISLHEWIESL
jgi:hypothetical protein